MKLYRFTFNHTAFSAIPEAEQLFFLRLAHVRNDLRHIDNLCLTAAATVGKESGIANDVALHQLVLNVRFFYGTLNEGWNAVKSSWDSDRLGPIFSARLSPEAMQAHKFLARYFSNSNLINDVRNASAFHYGTEGLKETLANVKSEEIHDFISGKISANVFYGFAEKVHMAAMLSLTKKTNAQDAVRTFYDEAHRIVYPKFMDFSDAVLLKIVESLHYQIEEVEISAVIDPRTVPAVLFVDPASIAS